MKTVLLLLRQEFKPAVTRIATEDEKRKTVRNPTRRDGSKAGRPVGLFFPEGRTYSPPPKCAAFWRWWYPTGWYPPNRAVRSPRGNGVCTFCGKHRTMRAALLASVQLSVLSLTAHPGIVRDAAVHCAARHLLFAKPVTGRFSKLAGRGFASGQLFREKVRITTAPLEPRNDEYERGIKTMKGSVRTVWQFTTWKRRSSAAGRDGPPAQRQPI